LRFSQWCNWGFWYSVMWHCVVSQTTGILEQCFVEQIIGCQSVWIFLFHLSIEVLFFIGKETKGSSYKEAREES